MYQRNQTALFFPFLFAIALLFAPSIWKNGAQRHISELFWKIYTLKEKQKIDKEYRQELEIESAAFATQDQEERIEKAREEVESDLYREAKRPHVITSVIFNEETSRSAAIWINIGAKEQEKSPFLIQRYCPVLSSGSVIGYIDYVGEKSSRVLLITDPKSVVSVRVKRIIPLKEKTILLGKSFQSSLNAYLREMTAPSESLQKASRAIEAIVTKLTSEEISSPLYFAYGYLQGALLLNRSKKQAPLRGYGFNCDLHREGSSKRDLRTGKKNPADMKISIIKADDLLETSGFDGIFPKGLPIASVSRVFPLTEGAASYTIEATPLREALESIHYVTILEALPQDTQNSPSPLDRILSQIEKEQIEK